MGYQLGIDLGTTYTAAAVCRANHRGRAEPEMVTLGARNATVASVLYLGADGSVLVGEAAERRTVTDPDRVVREFKRQIGDGTPLVVGGQLHPAHDLAARLVRWVVDRVAEREGGPADRIAVTHPASWGPHKKELFGRALTAVGVQATFLAEPQAAALSYASAERVEPGSLIAVYDLGGGTFDAAVVRKVGAADFELLGRAEGIERLGGVDFDEAVFEHVRVEVGEALDGLDPADPHAISAVARLRRECVEAKEALSADTEATIPVLLPELRTAVRLGRSEFEAMIRGGLEDTVEALCRAVTSAGLTPDDLTAVLLVGGSSRIPLVSQLVSAELARPVAVDADPKYAIAMGAALAVSPRRVAAPSGPGLPVPPAPPAPVTPPAPGTPPRGTPSVAPAGYLAPAGAAAPGTAGPTPPRGRPIASFTSPPTRIQSTVQHDQPQRGRRRPPGLMIGVGGIVAVAAVAAAVLLLDQRTPAVEPAGGPGGNLVSQTSAPPEPDPVVPADGGADDAPPDTLDTAEPPAPPSRSVEPTTDDPPPTTDDPTPTTDDAPPTTDSVEPTEDPNPPPPDGEALDQAPPLSGG